MLLEVKNLTTSFEGRQGKILAVDNISFNIKKGSIVGFVGESGCGKSITSLSLLRLIEPPGKIEQGEIIFEGKDLLKSSEKELQSIRGCEISMIFQEPMTSLNPVFSVGDQVCEVLVTHKKISYKEAQKETVELFKRVNIPSPEKRINSYPHELSGGIRQRVMIAMALACKPKLVIADEPTTALDVTIQAQILDLLLEEQKKLGMSVLLITHDLGIVANVCDFVYVMYAGKIIEGGKVSDIFESPKHPYTQGLLRSLPRLGVRVEKLSMIEGQVPSLSNLPKGCSFQPRCSKAMEICKTKRPEIKTLPNNQSYSCFLGENHE